MVGCARTVAAIVTLALAPVVALETVTVTVLAPVDAQVCELLMENEPDEPVMVPKLEELPSPQEIVADSELAVSEVIVSETVAITPLRTRPCVAVIAPPATTSCVVQAVPMHTLPALHEAAALSAPAALQVCT